MRAAVIGSRSASPDTYKLILKNLPINCSEIISGGAEGVDTLAKKAAKELGIRYTCIYPNYKKYGKAAPIIRNREIAERADIVFAFWNGYSKGTRYVLLYCIKKRIPFKIYMLEKENKISGQNIKNAP